MIPFFLFCKKLIIIIYRTSSSTHPEYTSNNYTWPTDQPSNSRFIVKFAYCNVLLLKLLSPTPPTYDLLCWIVTSYSVKVFGSSYSSRISQWRLMPHLIDRHSWPTFSSISLIYLIWHRVTFWKIAVASAK